MTTADLSPSSDRSAPPKVILTVCLLAGFAVLVDQNMIGVTLPTIEHALRMTGAQGTWAAAGYTLSVALTLIIGGRLGDDYGRRRILLISLTLFFLAALSCAAARDSTWLITSRICVGCAAGVASPQIVGLIQQMFGGPERGRAYGFYSATVSLSAVLGPLLGGAIITGLGASLGWRFVFLPSPVIALIALGCAYRLLPPDTVRPDRGPIDALGTVLLGLATLSVMLPVTEAGGNAHPAWWLVAVGLVLLGLFWLWEKRLETSARRPLVALKVVGRRSYTVGTLTVLLFFAGYPGVLLLVQFYLQRGLHYTALAAAASTMVFGIGSSLAAVAGGRLVSRFGRWIVIVGALAVTVGVGLMALLVGMSGHGGGVLGLTGPFLLAGLGSGFIMAPNQTLTMAEISRDEGSTAAGVYQTGMRLGSAIGVPLALALYSDGLRQWHGDVFKASALGLAGSAVLVGLALVVRVVDMVVDFEGLTVRRGQ